MRPFFFVSTTMMLFASREASASTLISASTLNRLFRGEEAPAADAAHLNATSTINIISNNNNKMQRHLKEGQHRRFHQAMAAHDFSEYSCQNIFQHTEDLMTDAVLRCAYALTCNEGDGILFASRVFCQNVDDNDGDDTEIKSPMEQFFILAAPLAIVLIVMFRILGSTAEEFFSPGLEMLSLELGLPERFAGVTLLALGNGAPDVASTVNAILNDRKSGYRLALGELTGAAMVASTVIVGAVTFVSPSAGIACRGALIRDIVMFIATMVVTYLAFADGTITIHEIHFFLIMYAVYVLVVLAADVYHKRNEISSTLRSVLSTDNLHDEETTGLVPKGSKAKPRRRISYDAVVEAISNYNGDDNGGREQRQDTDAFTHQDSNASASDEPLMVFHPHHGGMVDLKQSERFQQPCRSPDSWKQAWALAWKELLEHVRKLWAETYLTDQYNIVEKFLMTCELPFMVLRMLTIPVPCDGYYCRPIVGGSLALCPFWFWFYLWNQFDVHILENSALVVSLTVTVPLLLGLAVIRWAPCGGVPPRLAIAVPITLIGFVSSAAWLDLVADKLVDLLSFFGIMLHIPSTIMGLTVLAWGNSSQDLIANLTVARKGLSTMAITASFAGPVFNILIGLGIGLMLLYKSGDGTTTGPIPVELNTPLRLGFLFAVLNGVLVIFYGLWKGFLPRKFGYAAMLIYFAYVVASLTL